jgi:hypothetical protein
MNHYLCNKAYFWLGDDQWHTQFQGYIAYIRLNFGKGAYQEANYVIDDDRWGYSIG